MGTTKLNEYIANKVQLIAKANQKKYSDIANALNVSESFIQKIHIHQKHYNVSHLYILSRLFDCNVSEFFPSDYKDYKRVYPFSSLIESEFNDLLQQMEDEIRYGKGE